MKAMKQNKAKLMIELFKAKNGEWCYRVMHRNGREKFRASETYTRKSNCFKGLYRDLVSIETGDYWIVDSK